MTEADFLSAVLSLCERYHVLAFHDNDSRRNDAGFPDLLLCGSARICFAELKSLPGKLSREQTVWRYRLQAAGQRCYVWRPADLDAGTVESVLATL